MGANRQRLRDVAAGEHLDPLGAPGHQSLLAQEIRRDFRARVEPLAERIQIDDLVGLTERVVESTLRHAAMERHLSALEPALVLEARTRLRPLVSAPRLHALPRALAAANPLLRMRRTFGGT